MHRGRWRAHAHAEHAAHLADLAKTGFGQLFDHLGRVHLEFDLEPRLKTRPPANGGVAGIHGCKPIVEWQIIGRDITAPDIPGGQLNAAQDVVDHHGRIGRARPGGGLCPPLGPRSTDRAVETRVIKRDPVELEAHLRQAVIDLAVVAEGQNGIGRAMAHKAAAPGAVRIARIVLDQHRVGRRLASVIEFDPGVVFAAHTLAQQRKPIGAMRAAPQIGIAVIEDHAGQGNARDVRELDHIGQKPVWRIAILMAHGRADMMAGRGRAPQNERLGRGAASGGHGRLDAALFDLGFWAERTRDQRDPDRDCGIDDQGADKRACRKGRDSRNGPANGRANGGNGSTDRGHQLSLTAKARRISPRGTSPSPWGLRQ